MPKIGDICRARDIGLSGADGARKYKWTACEHCRIERWVVAKASNGKAGRWCVRCAPKYRAPSRTYKGGRIEISGGYVGIYYHPAMFKPMASRTGYIPEHRLIMAQYIGRCLDTKERVHHKNGNRRDNRLENLELHDGVASHMQEHNKGYRDGFEKGYADGLKAARTD